MPVPAHPKIYHIVHVDNLASIVAEGCMWSDAVMVQRQGGNVDRHGRTLSSAGLRTPGLPVIKGCVSGIASRSIFVRDRLCCMSSTARKPSEPDLPGGQAADRPSGGRFTSGRAMGGGERASAGRSRSRTPGHVYPVPCGVWLSWERSTGTPSRRTDFRPADVRGSQAGRVSGRATRSLGIWSSASACIPRPSCRGLRAPCRAPRIGR